MAPSTPFALDMLAERQFAGVPSVMFAAGVETTASAINTAIFAFVTHRNAFLALQKEIDSVVGDSRSPTLKDMSKLPYLNAVVQETLRWPAPVTVGVPHATTDDDVYEGWVILKGTSVISNAWAIYHNLAFFPSTHTFALERYLPPSDPRFNHSLVGEEFPGKWGHGTFGWGRRVCSGADLAMNSLRIVIAKLLWTLDIKGLDGEVYDIDAFESGTIMKPKKFECEFNIHSELHREVLERELRQAKEVLEMFPAFD